MFEPFFFLFPVKRVARGVGLKHVKNQRVIALSMLFVNV
jgi:hypothetical protein